MAPFLFAFFVFSDSAGKDRIFPIGDIPMKKSFLLILSSALLLCACGSRPSISSPSQDSTTSESSTASAPAMDFSLVSSCKAGSIEKESFTITTPNPNEEYSSWDDPVIEIAINQANWAYVTAIKKDNNPSSPKMKMLFLLARLP